jgi:ribokinase
MRDAIVVLGIFVADTAYRAARLPRMGETLIGTGFGLGPGGKGSNQAVAAAMAGGKVHFITRLGADAFADMAQAVWARAGVRPDITVDPQGHTGAAFVFVEDGTGQNAIIVAPGAARDLSPADADRHAALIGGAAVFVTQLEQPVAAALRGLQIARAGGAFTILNPAPAADLPPDMLALCDLVTPNEGEAAALTGIDVRTPDDAARAAGVLLARGAGAVVVTLGAEGALYRDRTRQVHVPACAAGPVVDTTGAGDAFTGALATALSEGADPVAAVRFGCAAAGLAVTRAGTAPAMPARAEIDALLSGRAPPAPQPRS